MSSRTDARRNLLAASKKKTDGQRQFSRPLENKKFYFHLKNRRPPSQLCQDLTSLGARVEPFFGKDVSCVITDQQDLRSASTPPKPNSVDSSGPSTSPSVFTGPSTSTGRSGDPKGTLHTGRGQALVRKAMQNVSGSTDVLELCRQWQIEVCYIKSFLPWLQKLKEKALLENARHGKENAKAKQVSEPPQKLVPPFIKVEDMRGVFRPLYRSLKQWPDVTAERCQQNASKPKEPAPKEPAPLPKESAASTKTPVEPVNDSHLKGVPLRPGTSKAAPRVKVTEQKKLNCEICGSSYICLEKHLESEKHQKFMKNSNNFSVVSDIIAMLPCNLPSRVAHPLSEINGQDWLTEAPSASGDEENILGLTAGQPWSSPPRPLSVKEGHHGVLKQSGFSGTISALRHLKVVRKESSPTIENLEKTSMAGSPNPRKRPGTFSNFETHATVKKDSRSLLRCNATDYKKNECVLQTAGGSRLRKRPATFSEFETQAMIKKDASVILCCSDMDGMKNECVPPSFSSELNGTASNLLAGLNVVESHPVSTPVENAGNFVCDMSEVFDKASEELFSDSSTAEYSWTDVVSGVVPEQTASRTQCDEASDPNSNDSFLEFVSRANTEEQLKSSHAVEDKTDRLCDAGDAGGLCSGNVHTVEAEPFVMRL
uniref:Protein kinase essential for the initiation of dna replication n=1 Tax=Rhipicephalus appendiculatus TaxID=34631 RepID=A0A131YLP4_RHIAP